ncbi:hypothetical protein MLD38_022394 [Melastoma candidum]|uniref:Uncharacterized protein n=1 Tax=Melastoma candidum TaxID=119954 RepID=A0ACB9QJ97_9MYRT|nr:hypothetical protein MLD38_022394 [Melastoma candidum]
MSAGDQHYGTFCLGVTRNDAMLPGPAIPLLSQGGSWDSQQFFLEGNTRSIKFVALKSAATLNPFCSASYAADVTNVIFNISALNLVRLSLAVVAFLAVILSVPMSIYSLSLPLPYLLEVRV